MRQSQHERLGAVARGAVAEDIDLTEGLRIT